MLYPGVEFTDNFGHHSCTVLVPLNLASPTGDTSKLFGGASAVWRRACLLTLNLVDLILRPTVITHYSSNDRCGCMTVSNIKDKSAETKKSVWHTVYSTYPRQEASGKQVFAKIYDRKSAHITNSPHTRISGYFLPGGQVIRYSTLQSSVRCLKADISQWLTRACSG